MPNPIVYLFSKIDTIYRERLYLDRVKARLFAGFCGLLLLLIPMNVVKLISYELPAVAARVGINLVIFVAALFCLRKVLQGKLQPAANALVISLLLPIHAFLLYQDTFLEPVSVLFQLMIFDLIVLGLAILFASIPFVVAALVIILSGQVSFYVLMMGDQSLPGTLEFTAQTLLRDGLITTGFVFLTGTILAILIKKTSHRSEKALSRARKVNAQLEELVAQRTAELERVSQTATQASMAKSEFLANMSHEICTPLNGIIGTTEMLLGQTDLSERTRDQLQTVSFSGDILIHLVRNILDFSKIEAGQLRLEEHNFDLRQLLSDCSNQLSQEIEKSGLTAHLLLEEDLGTFYIGDSYRLRQVLLNLWSNAIKFTPFGGEIKMAAIPESRLGTSHQIRFAISDTGIGLDAFTQGQIFKRFTQGDSSTTRRFGGSGLGLSIASQLVELMSGELKIESRVDEGSTFYFTIPLASVAAPDLPAPSLPDNSPLNLRALVVEDNPVNRKMLCAQLSKLGCTWVVAIDGEKAVQALQNDPLPEVILMDCHMPNLDGWAATKKIKSWAGNASVSPQQRTAGELPIIAVTAAITPLDQQRCVDAGMSDIVEKPVRLGKLRDSLMQIVSARS